LLQAIFSLMHNIAKVIYCVKNPHSITTPMNMVSAREQNESVN